MTDAPRAVSMTALTAMRLIDTLNQLRTEIARQGVLLESIDVGMSAMYKELHDSNLLRRPRGGLSDA
jgi:hypothetical protein